MKDYETQSSFSIAGKGPAVRKGAKVWTRFEVDSSSFLQNAKVLSGLTASTL
jgi:hypothetical protein